MTGPQAQLNRQGPALVRALERRDDTRVLSAWAAGEAGAAMRPSRSEAMILASVARNEQQLVDRYKNSIDETPPFSGVGAMTIVGKAFDVDAIGIALTSVMGLRSAPVSRS